MSDEVTNEATPEELYQARLRRGGVSPVDMVQEDHPELTRAECRQLMEMYV